ncbi:Zinc transporter 2-like protein [Leptotrombidium deliense]|uniref:Zinc transporter 2-like protein n=1 Tax=Leptotrombidium deliense TaxID=299467 RepID=A0A443SVU8_9ACAR|nr:Zinc transporter 2-like protein [Leptotrombidium deliense]
MRLNFNFRVAVKGEKAYYESVIIDESNRSMIYCAHGNDAKNCREKVETGEQCNGGRTRRSVSFSHCHSGEMEPSVDKSARKKLIFASVLCLLFMLAEAVGGILSNSLAIATDAAHLLTDFASFMISLFSLWIATRPATKRMSFGWYRAEVIGALTSVLMIWVVTGILVYLAVERIINKTYEVEADVMLITAAIGVLVNIIMGISLQCGGVPHGHSHGGDVETTSHSHKHSHEEHKTNINVRAAFIHVLGDFFQSVGVLVAAAVIYFKPDWAIIDPICTFFFSVVVLITTFNIIKDVLNVLMEGIPKGIDFLEVQRTLFNIQGVVRVHNLRIWALSMDKIALSTHLAIDNNEDPSMVLKRASNLMRRKFNIFDLTIQVEEYRDEMKDCNQCKIPE